MKCPYCGSRKVSEQYTYREYDVGSEYVSIDHVECGKCGGFYSKTVRNNPSTGRRKVIVSKGSPIPGTVSYSKKRSRGILGRFSRRLRR